STLARRRLSFPAGPQIENARLRWSRALRPSLGVGLSDQDGREQHAADRHGGDRREEGVREIAHVVFPCIGSPRGDAPCRWCNAQHYAIAKNVTAVALRATA